MSREIEIQLKETIARLERIESEITHLKNPPSKEWMTPTEIEEYSRGKYTTAQLVTSIKNAIGRPADYPFKLGVHYTFTSVGNRRLYRINYFEYDRAVELMCRREMEKENQ